MCGTARIRAVACRSLWCVTPGWRWDPRAIRRKCGQRAWSDFEALIVGVCGRYFPAPFFCPALGGTELSDGGPIVVLCPAGNDGSTFGRSIPPCAARAGPLWSTDWRSVVTGLPAGAIAPGAEDRGLPSDTSAVEPDALEREVPILAGASASGKEGPFIFPVPVRPLPRLPEAASSWPPAFGLPAVPVPAFTPPPAPKPGFPNKGFPGPAEPSEKLLPGRPGTPPPETIPW